MDKRTDPRFPKAMKAFPLGGGTEAVLETDNISATGAYFVGDPGVPVGTEFWLRLEVGSSQRGRDSIFPLCVEVRVSRLSRSGDGSIAGFGAEWRAAWSADDATPLKEFLRRTLNLSSGYIESVPPRRPDGRPSFLYVFPAGAVPVPAGATPYEQQAALEAVPPPQPPPVPPANAPEGFEDGVELDGAAGVAPRGEGRAAVAVYVTVPLTWSVDENEHEGRATKLTATGIRISTTAELPGPYRRVTIRIQIRQRDRSGTLALSGTVVTQRPPREEGQESQMEIQLTLGNDPDSLHLYRRLLDRLSSMATPAGA